MPNRHVWIRLCVQLDLTLFSSLDLFGPVRTRDSILPVQIPVRRIKNKHRRVSWINVTFDQYTYWISAKSYSLNILFLSEKKQIHSISLACSVVLELLGENVRVPLPSYQDRRDISVRSKTHNKNKSGKLNFTWNTIELFKYNKIKHNIYK